MSGVAVQRPFKFGAKKKRLAQEILAEDFAILRKCAPRNVDYVYRSQWSSGPMRMDIDYKSTT